MVRPMQNTNEKPQTPATTPRFYSLRNYMSVGFHYAAAAGLAAASYAFAAPWAITTAAVITLPLYAIVLKVSKRHYETGMTEHKKSYPYSPYLGRTMQELYTKSGLKSENHPVYDFQSKSSAVKDDKSSIYDLMKKVPNAAAFSLGKPIIMISEPLLKLLNDEEEKAVLAHEFAHIKSKHIPIKIPLMVLNRIGGMANGLTLIGAAMAAGFWKWSGVMAGGIAATIAGNKLLMGKELRAKKDDDLTVKEIYRKKQVERIVSPVAQVMVLGGLGYLNPAYPALWLTAKGIGITEKILTGTFSRSSEYQADKGAVALDANPLALITSLRKITALMERSREHAWGNEPVPQPGYLRKAWKEATATHPTLENRVARLADLARKQGYDEESIRQAATGPLDISEVEDVPYDVLKAMAQAL